MAKILKDVASKAVKATKRGPSAGKGAGKGGMDLQLFAEGAGKVIDDLPTGGKITGYTRHGTEQALGRDGGIGVSNKAITNAVNNPVKPPIPQSGGTTKYIGKDATVVLNQDGKVVTTWANSSAGTR
jgi:hypothetical protein